MLTARFDAVGRSMEKLSLNTLAPTGIVTEGLPLKERTLAESRTMLSPPALKAACAPERVSGVVPISFVKTTRTVFPANDVCTICRMVKSADPMVPLLLSIPTGAAAQVPTQCGSSLFCACISGKIAMKQSTETKITECGNTLDSH